MSMFEALRNLVFGEEQKKTPDAPEKPDEVEEHRRLVEQARVEGALDTRSGTWMFVSSWAARELLRARARLESASEEKAVALRERCKVLKEILRLEENQRRKRIVVRDSGPDIP